MHTDDPEFWKRVERAMLKSSPIAYYLQNTMMKAGIYITVITALYFMVLTLLSPSSGYFFSPLERTVHPFVWCAIGVILILIGAFFRYRAMGPAMEKVKRLAQ